MPEQSPKDSFNAAARKFHAARASARATTFEIESRSFCDAFRRNWTAANDAEKAEIATLFIANMATTIGLLRQQTNEAAAICLSAAAAGMFNTLLDVAPQALAAEKQVPIFSIIEQESRAVRLAAEKPYSGLTGAALRHAADTLDLMLKAFPKPEPELPPPPPAPPQKAPGQEIQALGDFSPRSCYS